MFILAFTKEHKTMVVQVWLHLDQTSSHPFVRRILDGLGQNDKIKVGGLTFYQSSEGPYISTHHVLGGSPNALKGVPLGKVTLRDSGMKPAPLFGYFKSSTAEGYCTQATYYPCLGVEGAIPDGWSIEIAGKDFDSVVDLHKEMRSSSAIPVRYWGSPSLHVESDTSPIDVLSPFSSRQHSTRVALEHLRYELQSGRMSVDELLKQLV